MIQWNLSRTATCDQSLASDHNAQCKWEYGCTFNEKVNLERNHISMESDGQDSLDLVQGLIRVGLIKDPIWPCTAVYRPLR